MDKFRILIVDPSAEFRAEVAAALAGNARFQVVGAAGSREEADCIAREQKPDMLLLKPDPDAPVRMNREQFIANMLHEVGIPANIRGYRYLLDAVKLAAQNPDAVSSMEESVYTPIADRFFTTPSKVRSAIRRAIEIGWDRGNLDALQAYFGYSVSNTRGMPTNSEFIAIIAEKVRYSELPVAVSGGENQPKVDSMIADILGEIGIPAHSKGCQYLREAILIAVYDAVNEMEGLSVTNVLYPWLAKTFDTVPSRVECAMRHVIEVAWDRCDPDTVQRFFGCTVSYTKGKPTNSEFIAMIAEKIRLQLQPTEAVQD